MRSRRIAGTGCDRKGAIYTPKTIEFVDLFLSLPLKADKKVIRAQYWAAADRSI